MKISVVIPNYNGEKLLEKNLPKVVDAVKEYNNQKEIIITDDASTDNSQIVVEQLQKTSHTVIHFIKSPWVKRSGYSSNVNRGVKRASGDIIVLLNTDVIPHKDFLRQLMKHFEDDNVFGVGCMDESIEDGKVILRGRGLGEWRKGFLIHRPGPTDKMTTLWVSGGSGAFRKTIWEKLGGLDEIYDPFYWEDIDISYRGVKSGYTILFEPKSIVVHQHTEGAIKIYFKRYHIIKNAYRNQFIFVWKNATDMPILLTHIAWLPIHMIKAILRGDSAFLFGFFAALLKLPQIIQHRVEEIKLFIKTDTEVIAAQDI